MASYISPKMRRVLGAGVARLMDGDLRDRSDAEEVICDLRDEGYVYEEPGTFLSRNAILVNGSMHPDGVWTKDLETVEKESVIRALLVLAQPCGGAMLPEVNLLIDKCRYLELPDGVIDELAHHVRFIRKLKGLRFEPADLG